MPHRQTVGIVATLAAASLAGCAGHVVSPPTSQASTPTPVPQSTPIVATHGSAPSSPIAVVVSGDGLGSTSQSATYSIFVVDDQGQYRRASAQLWSYTQPVSTAISRGQTVRLWPTPLPRISTSLDRVYYIDGDATLRWRAADGTNGIVPITLPGNRQTQVIVAIDPNDEQLAIGTVHYAVDAAGFDVAPAEVRITTQRLAGGSVRSVLDYVVGASIPPGGPANPPVEWPVGWVQGNLVVATGQPGLQGSQTTAAAPDDELLVDVSNGRTLLDICPSGVLFDPIRLTGTGTVCGVLDGSRPPDLVAWNGVRTSLSALGTCTRGAARSPAGDRFAIEGAPSDGAGGCSFAGPMTLIGPGEARSALPVAGIPIGWLDAQHVIYRAFDNPSPTAGPSQTLSIVDLASGAHLDSGLVGSIEGYSPATTTAPSP